MRHFERLSFLLIAAFIGSAFGDEQCLGKRREDIYNNRRRLFDQDFGMALTPDDFLTSMSSFMSPFSVFRDYFRPWRHIAALSKDIGSTIKTDKDKFQINLDVQHFSPDEITVKTVDGYIVVEAKHEEKKDEHGLVSRQFVRRYNLPEGVEEESVVSQLSSDGVLTVTAPRKAVEEKGARVVPITQTGPVRKQAQNDEQCDSETCVATEEK